MGKYVVIQDSYIDNRYIKADEGYVVEIDETVMRPGPNLRLIDEPKPRGKRAQPAEGDGE